LASALAGGDIVMVEPACDLTEGGTVGVLAVYTGDHLRRECRFAAGARCAPRPSARFLLSLGEVAFELADRDQPRAPLGLDGRDRRHHAPVERRQADAERLRSLIPRVRERLDPAGEAAVVRPEQSGRLGGVPPLLFASPLLPALRHRSPPLSTPYSNAEAYLHRMMHLCLACY
jgi:hypothetical protein